MVDNDQGGTFRQLSRVTLGPSIGQLDGQDYVRLTVASAGTTQVPVGYTEITVNVSGSAVILQLAKVKGLVGITNPGTNVVRDLTIGDVSGGAPNITILPGAGETIDNLASITISTAFGFHTLRPDVINGGWIIKI